MVNSKPLMGYMWDPSVGMKKIEPKKVPVWIKPFEVPMEAWTTKGIMLIRALKRLLSYNIEISSTKWWGLRLLMWFMIGSLLFVLILLCLVMIIKVVRVKWTKKNANEGSDVNRNKVNIFYENFPVLNTKKSQEIHNNKKGKPVGDNNSFTILRDLKDDNIEGINMMKDKMIVDNLDDMEEMVEDVLEDESEAAKNLVADESDLRLAKCITNGYPWILMGDFNVTLKLEEHSTKKSTISNDMQEFIDCVNNIGVEDVCMSGMFYTPGSSPSNPNTSILKKLDRVMANDEFISKFNHAHVVSHPFIVSDHSPAVLILPHAMIKKKKSFKFVNFVAEKSDFLPIVERIWKENVNGFHMFQLVKKLKLLKRHLKRLQWKNGDVFERVVCLRNKLKAAQLDVSQFPHDSEKNKIAARGFKITEEFVNHFDKFLGQSSPVAQLDTLGNIFTTSLTKSEAEAMVSDISDLEIKTAMFGIGDCKAPGLNDYTACFFKKAWLIVGNDVCLAIKEFFKTGKLLKEINSIVIALIPKIHHPKLVTNFRPIACCNGYNRKCGSKRCALKIDIPKSYDIVSWEFLRNVLIKFGFHLKMVYWIYNCISSSAFSLCVSGEVHGYFSGGRGLRQGDPISPYLLTLVMEVFTLIMAHKSKHSSHIRYHPGCKELKLTHLCFANDLLVL
ncbi:RNA-directed DNA polymerase, eukaryota, reverse transcriptase zinc-binding domain protein [Tanacetum coccineum]